jgi:predicted metal-dependent RNase
MRYGDYSGLENLKHTDKFITKRTKKTGAKVVIPMHWVIREILERRGNMLPKAVSNQKLNDALKELGQLADITDEIELTVTRAGKQVTTRRPKYELMTTHTARRSGCTNMYLAGIDIYTIMGFSGHTTEKSFRKYIKIKQEENAQRFLEHPFFKKDLLCK